MHGSIHSRLAWTLAITLTCGLSAQAQQWGPADPGMPAYETAPVNQPVAADVAAQPVAMPADPGDPASLARRLADVEKQLKDAKAKEEAAKAKAALEPSVKFGGRVQWDTDTFNQNNLSQTTAGDALNGSEFRRLYFSAYGTMFEVIDYKAEVDLVPSHIAWKDVYINFKELPIVQNVRIGHMYTPFGLETETSDLNTVFMERSLIDAIGGVGSRHAGAMAFGNALDERSWWGFGAFASQVNEAPPTFPVSGFDDAGGTALYGRVTFLPWYDEATNGRGLWHVGISGERGEIPEIKTAGTTRFQVTQRPEAHLAPNVVFTGDLADAELVNAVNAETALVYGPLSIQAEYEWLNVQRTAHADPTFKGGYVFVSYFLTGENRQYNRKTATFSRIIPFENFFRVRGVDQCIHTGKGAWEIGYRASYLDLNDAGVLGGRVVDQTVGLNWYLNPYTKVMFDLVHSETEDIRKSGTVYTGSSIINSFLTRVQFDF